MMATKKHEMNHNNTTINGPMAHAVVLQDGLRCGQLPSWVLPYITDKHRHWLGGSRLTTVICLDMPVDALEAFVQWAASELRLRGYYAHAVAGDHLWVVFPGKVHTVNRGDTQRFEEMRNYGESMGIPRSQMRFEGLFERDHPNQSINTPQPHIPSAAELFRPRSSDEHGRMVLCGRVLDCIEEGEMVRVSLFSDGEYLSVLLPSMPGPERWDIIGVEGKLDHDTVPPLLTAGRWAVLTASHMDQENISVIQSLREFQILKDQALRDAVQVRSKVIRSIRKFFDERGFHETETSILLPVRDIAPVNHFALARPNCGANVLRICPENQLKRLIVAGYDRVYEIARCFRNESADDEHLPEFSSIECYQAYASYEDMASLFQELLKWVVTDVTGTDSITFGGQTYSLSEPWQRVYYVEAVRNLFHIDIEAIKTQAELVDAMRTGCTDVHETMPPRVLYSILAEHIEKTLDAPSLLMDYPAETICVAKRHEDRPHLIERFEAFLGGMEIAHAFTELSDPVEQRNRMRLLMLEKTAAGESEHPLDEAFLAALYFGLPPTAGLGIGIDRLVMMITGEPIHRTTFFPMN